jgi:hypothetical protein
VPSEHLPYGPRIRAAGVERSTSLGQQIAAISIDVAGSWLNDHG